MFKIRKKIFLLFFVLLLILPSVFPLFNNKFFKMHDFTHVARLVELDLALKDGHFPSYWAKDLGWGYGMPLFHFYAPLPYFIAEIFHLIGFNFLNSIKATFCLTFIIGFFGMFFLAKKFWGWFGGLIAAISFIYSPYRAVDFYVRGALGELLALSLIPWVLWLFLELIDNFESKKEKITKKIMLSALFLALFFLSHTVLNLITFPFFLFWVLLFWFIQRRKFTDLFKIIIVFFLGFSLSGFFLLPAFLEKKYTQVESLTLDYSHYSHHFLYWHQFLRGYWGYGGSVDGPNDGLSFHLGKVHLFFVFLTFVSIYFFLCFNKKITRKEVSAFFIILIGFFFAFLATYKAKFIWDTFPLMAYIQFPWRFNSLLIVILAFLSGGFIYYWQKFLPKLLIYILFFLSLTVLLLTNVKYFKPQEYFNPKEICFCKREEIKKVISGIIPDYLPLWVKKKLEPQDVSFTPFKVIDGKAEIRVLTDKTDKLVLAIEAEESFKLQINKFYFPGWEIRKSDIQAEKEKINFNYQDNNGIIWANLPKGFYQLEIVYGKTLIRKISECISLFSLIFIFFFFFKEQIIKIIKKRITFFLLFFLISASFFLFYPLAKTSFFQDDYFLLDISQAQNFKEFLAFFKPRQDVIFYRPLSMQIWYFLLRTFFDLKSYWFHLSGLIIFLFNLLVLYRLLLKITKKKELAFLTTFFYGTSGIHYLSLIWSAAFHYIIGCLFFNLSLYFFVSYNHKRKKSDFLFSLIFYILALLSEETSFFLFFLIFYFLIIFKGFKGKISFLREKIKILLPFFLIASFYLFFRFKVAKIPFGQEDYIFKIDNKIFKNLYWHILWVLNIPEDFKFQWLSFSKINPLFIKDFSFYFYSLFGLFIFVVILIYFLPLFFLIKNLIKKRSFRKIFFKFSFFGLGWFFLGLIPAIFFPYHQYPYFLTFSAIGFYLFFLIPLGLLVSSFGQKKIRKIGFSGLLICLWYLFSFLNLDFTKKTHWANRRARYSYFYLQKTLNKLSYPTVNDLIFIFFTPNCISCQEIKHALMKDKAFKVIYNNRQVRVRYGDRIPYEEACGRKKIYSIN